MRRIAVFLCTVLLLVTMITGVSAASQVTSAAAHATVSADGSCQCTITATIRLDQVAEDLTFPVPKEASGITLNGTRVRTRVKDSVRLIDLSSLLNGMTGTFTVSVNYTLHDVIHTTEADLLELRVPLLCGFAYPVQAFDFSVTLPGGFTAKPAFSSGYHQADIEKDLSFMVSGAMVSGTTQKELKDHETLTMLLTVSEEMFPQTTIELPDLVVLNIAMTVCAILALLYWLLFLRCAPVFPHTQTAPPEGCTAGELGSVLHLQGVDLTMMVFTWAQLGYVVIHSDRHGRVTLHKQMEMGNERGNLEQRCFKKLFGKRSSVDTSGTYYATLCQAAETLTPSLQTFVRPFSGNPRLFRALAATMGLFAGIALGITLSAGAALQWLVVCVLAVLGGISCWIIQRWAYNLYAYDKRKLYIGLTLCLLWIVLAAVAGQLGIGILVSLVQLLAGWMAAFGGLRTEAGRHAMHQVLGLRRYLRTVDRETLLRICSNDPDYFHSLMPYALALGADKAFARHFGNARLPECPYLIADWDAPQTAAQWSAVMRRTVNAMNERRKQLSGETLLRLFR